MSVFPNSSTGITRFTPTGTTPIEGREGRVSPRPTIEQASTQQLNPVTGNPTTDIRALQPQLFGDVPHTPFAVNQRPLSIENPGLFGQMQGDFFSQLESGFFPRSESSATAAAAAAPDPIAQLINELIASIGSGGGAAPEPAPPAPQQLDSAFSESLIQLIGGLFQAMLLSGQLGGGGAVGQQAAAPQVVFRSDLDRLGANRF